MNGRTFPTPRSEHRPSLHVLLIPCSTSNAYRHGLLQPSTASSTSRRAAEGFERDPTRPARSFSHTNLTSAPGLPGSWYCACIPCDAFAVPGNEGSSDGKCEPCRRRPSRRPRALSARSQSRPTTADSSAHSHRHDNGTRTRTWGRYHSCAWVTSKCHLSLRLAMQHHHPLTREN
jgi:hypothetical protein